MAAPIAKSKEQLLARRQRVSELYLECNSMAEIAVEIGVGVNTIYRDICWAREQWRSKAVDAIEKHKQRELARIDYLELEAWRAWRRTIGTHVVETHKTVTVDMPGSGSNESTTQLALPADQITRKSERFAGDPRFLDIVAKCIESRRKILGLDAPAQISGAGGGPVTFLIEGISGAEWLKKQTEASD